MKKLIALFAVVSVLGLVGCNTVEGAGKDVKAVGNATTNGAKDVSRKMETPSHPTKSE